MTRSEELRAELKKLEAEDRAQGEVRRKKAEAAYKALPFETQIHATTYTDLGQSQAVPALHVQCRREPAAYAAYAAEYGEHVGHNKWHGMVYYRTDENILTSGGGGSHILKVPKLCSDEEWAAIERNEIPEKFRKYW